VLAPSANGAAPRVLVADDSTFMRRLLAQALRDTGFDVVGEAADGDEALALCRTLAPDAMTLDLAMPGMDGIGVLRALRTQAPLDRTVPVVVVSAFSPAHGARAVDALAEGAFDLVAKPAFGEPLEQFVATLADKVGLAAAGATAAPAPFSATTRVSGAVSTRRAQRLPRRPRAAPASGRVVLIAVSTGGPRALAQLLPRLPERLGAGALVVQHMPAGFTTSLAERLDRGAALTVREAAGGDALTPDTLLLAPGGSHLRLDGGAGRPVVRLSDDPPVGGLRPRADLTIADAAKAFGERLVLVVMTGMGKDGLEGAREVRARGGRVLAEAESSCTVYGMPRAVVEARLADDVVALDELHEAIVAEAGA
jgi:two-component system, chemotaxis family, protein-glutamate methylesterase/glutaminase